MARATFPRAGTHPKHHSSRRLTTPSPRLGRVSRGYPATWQPQPGWSPPPMLAGLQICRRWATDSLSNAVYVSEEVCIRWCNTGAYYTAKLTFSNDFPSKVWVCIVQVCVLYSNFYGKHLVTVKATVSFMWLFLVHLVGRKGIRPVKILSGGVLARLSV